ncbi:hypothetical protein AAU61_21375 [Desulfocarbo indianensis]|nr:hypothetical protein AAU61_21375 [Desulfocarbo indianensis]
MGRTLRSLLAGAEEHQIHGMAGLNRLALAAWRQKAHGDARLLLEASLQLMERVSVSEHMEGRLAFSILANIERESGDHALAAGYAAKAEEGLRLAEEKNKCTALETMINLAEYHFLCQDFKSAEKLYRKVLTSLDQVYSQGDPSFTCCKEKAESFCHGLGQAGQTALQNRLALVLRRYEK